MALPPPAPGSTALVTGASSGIGAEIARELARRGHGVTLVARREDRLRELADEIVAAHDVAVEVIAADLADAASRAAMIKRIDAAGISVEILVNNAGFGSYGNLVDQEREREVEMVRLNVEALTDLQARYLPDMVRRGRGAIINIASTAAFQPMPANATYAATKAFVLNQGEALSEELKGTGVSVTVVCPGPVKTEFADVAGVGEMAEKAPDLVWMTPDQIAAEAVEGAARGKRTIVPGRLNQATAAIGRHTPRAISLPLVSRIWGRDA